MTIKDSSWQRARYFLPDVPVDSEEADSFGHGDLANNLETAIRFNQGRVMIGLLGGFGVGKSSVIRLLEKRLSGDRVVLRISAERHEIPVFHRAFVFAFAEAVKKAELLSREKIETELEILNYSSSQQLTDWRLAPAVRVLSRLFGGIGRSIARRALAFSGLAAMTTVALFLILLVSGVPVIAEIWTWLIGLVAVAVATPVFGALISLASGHGLATLGSAFKPGVVNRLRPRVEAADEYERVFANIVELLPQQIVIAIDDVDRLSANDVLPALNAIRSFQLTSEMQPAFIVSADEDVIARAIKESNPSLAGNGEGDEAIVAEYLSRLFTHRQQMPPHAFTDLRSYARQLLESPPHPALNKLAADLDSVVQVLVHDGVKNPRHVIRLVNSFLADYRLATLREQRSGVQSIKDGTVTSNPKVLARLAVLRLDFPRFYRLFATDTQLLSRIEGVARADSEEDTAAAVAREVGIDNPEGPEYKALEAYIARTAGWVEDVDDLLPFIYLGQDEIDRAVGSATVRRVRSILTNGLTADFLSYLDESSEEKNDVVALIRSTIDGLTGPELSNALTVLDGAAASKSTEDWLPALAESFATSIKRSPAPELSVQGLSRLAAAAAKPRQTAILDVLLELGKDDIAWSMALVETRPTMNPAIADSTRMKNRIKLAVALIGEFGDVTQLSQVGSALTEPSNLDVAHEALFAHLRVLSNEQDGTEEIRAAVAKLSSAAASGVSLAEALPMLAKMISEPGSISSAIAFDVMDSMELTDPESLATLSFNITLNSLSDDKFVDGVDEDYLAGSTPALLAALEHSSTWSRPDGDVEVALPRAVGQFLSVGAEWFSWIDDFTEPITRALQAFPSELSPFVSTVARGFEGYTDQDTVQSQWDLVISMFDELIATDQQIVIDALVRTLSNPDDEARSIAVGKIPMFLSTVKGANSVNAIATSIESNLSRTTPHLLDALEVLLSGSGASEERQQSTAQSIANNLLSYTGTRHEAVNALCSISWQPSVRSQVAQLLAPHSSEIASDQILSFAGPMEPLTAPTDLAPLLERAAADSLERGEVGAASKAVGNLSPTMTARIAVRSTTDISERLQTWLEQLDGQRGEAIDALLAAVGDESLKQSAVDRALSAYAKADQELYDARVADLINCEVIDHVKSVGARGWSFVLSHAGNPALTAVAEAIITAWVKGSASDAAATVGPGQAARTVSQLDVQLAPQIVNALERWTVATPNDAVANVLGVIARGGTHLTEAARQHLNRPGPRKDHSARDAFRRAKSSFGLTP